MRAAAIDVALAMLTVLAATDGHSRALASDVCYMPRPAEPTLLLGAQKPCIRTHCARTIHEEFV
jgi:hypothetical protein